MALTPEERARLDAVLKARNKQTPQTAPTLPIRTNTLPAAPAKPSALSPADKAKLDAVLAKRNPVTPAAVVETPKASLPKRALDTIKHFDQGAATRNFLVGQAKSFPDTALGMAQLGSGLLEKGYNATIGKIPGVGPAYDGAGLAKAGRESKYVAPQGKAQGAGFITGKVGQAFIPGALGMNGAGAASSMSMLPTAARATAAFTAEAAPQVLLASANEGRFSKDAVISGGMQGLGTVGGKIPNVILGLGQTAKGVKEIYDGDITSGAVDIGFGALGFKGALNTKGAIINRSIIPPNKEKAAREAAETIDTIIGAQPREAKIAQRKTLGGQSVKTPGQIATEHGVFGLTSDANGRLDTTAARQDISEKIESWDDLLTKSLDNEYKHNSLTRERDSIIKKISSKAELSNLSASDRKAAIKDIEDFFADEIAQAGDLVTDAELNGIKRGLNSAYKNGDPRLGYEAQRVARSSIQNTIEVNVKDVQVRKINQMMGELLDLDRSLKAKQGGVIQGGKLTKKLNGIVGSIVGSKFGPLGALAGAQAGESATEYALDPYRRAMAAKNGLDLSGFVQPGQKFRTEVSQSLQQRMSDKITGRGQPLRLPAPKEAPIQLPGSTGKSGIMSQEEAVTNLRSSGYQGPLTQREMQLRTPALPPGTIQLDEGQDAARRRIMQSNYIPTRGQMKISSQRTARANIPKRKPTK